MGTQLCRDRRPRRLSHALFSAGPAIRQHATFLNVRFGSSYDADDTHGGAMLHPGVGGPGRRRSRPPSTAARQDPRMLAPSSPDTRPLSAFGLSMTSPGHSDAASRARATCAVLALRRSRRLLFRGDDERKITRGDRAAGSYPSGVGSLLSGSSGKRIQAANSGAMRGGGRAASPERFSGTARHLEAPAASPGLCDGCKHLP